MRILLAEDDLSLAKAVATMLQKNNYAVDVVYNGEDALSYLESDLFDAAILDIMMPKVDGITVLKTIRKTGNPIPVLLLTAKQQIEDKVLGLDLGADDYLAKPFGMMEMISHIRAVLRRTQPKAKPEHLQFGQLNMDLSQHQVTVSGQSVQLTRKEYELLRLFLENPGRVYTRDQLLESIWGIDFAGETRTVDVHIGTLRTKLDACGEYIRTVRGVGYRLEAKA